MHNICIILYYKLYTITQHISFFEYTISGSIWLTGNPFMVSFEMAHRHTIRRKEAILVFINTNGKLIANAMALNL